MNILGISCFYHDSSACLLQNGRAVAASQEERFSRLKNTSEFPIQSINFCVQQAGIRFDEIDYVAYFEKPFLKFSRVILDHLTHFPFSFKGFMRSMPFWLDERLSLPLKVENELSFDKKIFFVKHHMSHAASAFYPSGFEEAAIMTADGVGEWATFSRGVGRGSEIKINREIHYPDSLGLLYTVFTLYLGFQAHGEEGKTMGLAGYGEPTYLKKLKEAVLVREDGSFRLDPKYFSFCGGTKMWTRLFEKTFGPPRKRGEKYEQRHFDLAASVQKLTEEIIVLNARELHRETKLDNLCLAGGVTLNCLANHLILEQTDFKNVFVQPAAGDAGGSYGAALYAYHALLKKPERVALEDAYLGPSFTDREIQKALSQAGITARKLETPLEIATETAKQLAENKVVGWFQGRMEYGPRALGSRSILGNPCNPNMKAILNDRVKKREEFRPYAPLVIEEKAQDYFELKNISPYMLLAARVRKEKQSILPAITHVDGTARVQTVDKKSNPLLRSLLEEFEKIQGVPIIINTSFNRNGEPVVCQPAQAIDCYKQTQMDTLVIGSYVATKAGAPS